METGQSCKKGLKKGIYNFLFNFWSRFYKKSNITSIYFQRKIFFQRTKNNTKKHLYYTKCNITALLFILKVFHYLEKLKRKSIIPFLRPFAKNDIFLLYIVFFHKLQKVSKKVYKKCKKYFLHFFA